MKVAFQSIEIAFFNEFFIMSNRNGFCINYKLCASIRSFFLLVDTILEVRCKPIFFASGNEFFIECFILTSEKRFSIQFSFIQSKFCASGSHFFLFFQDTFAGEDSFFAKWKCIFLTNPSFWLMESEFLLMGNSFTLFTAIFNAIGNHYQL